MTRIALITTTINVPTVLTQWVESGMTEDDVIIVAGDRKSPHVDIKALLSQISTEHSITTQYMPPEDHERFTVSDSIGWNCIQRRNIALLRAMELKPEFIITIDDDNAPTATNQITRLITIMRGEREYQASAVSTNTRWYNPGRHCHTDLGRPVVHRGYPLSQRHVTPLYTYEHRQPPIGVAAMLWTGEPDIDAVERIVNRPNVTHIDGSMTLMPGTWAPFNTQATMIRGDLAPALFMFPHVGRYDDIWASYVYRRIADKRGYGAYYGRPAVHQDRNEHDLLRDLYDELFGMQWNERFIERVQSTTLRDDDSVLTDVAEIYVDLMAANGRFLPLPTIVAMEDWINDVEKVLHG